MNKQKARQSAKHKLKGTYAKQFLRTVERTGRWRGHDARTSDLGTENVNPTRKETRR